MFSYKNICSFTAVLTATLCITLIAVPEVIYWLFSLQANDVASFLAKRAGVLFLGFSVLCFLSRSSSNDEVQRLVSASIVSAMVAMALLGIYELLRGNAGLGILIAILVEAAIAILFTRILIQAKQPNTA